jgi:hypothetical protein
VLDAGGGLNAFLAWIYVALRIAHSLIHAFINVVMLRFAVFMAASIALLAIGTRRPDRVLDGNGRLPERKRPFCFGHSPHPNR